MCHELFSLGVCVCVSVCECLIRLALVSRRIALEGAEHICKLHATSCTFFHEGLQPMDELHRLALGEQHKFQQNSEQRYSKAL